MGRRPMGAYRRSRWCQGSWLGEARGTGSAGSTRPRDGTRLGSELGASLCQMVCASGVNRMTRSASESNGGVANHAVHTLDARRQCPRPSLLLQMSRQIWVLAMPHSNCSALSFDGNPCTSICITHGRLFFVLDAPCVSSPLCWRMRRGGFGGSSQCDEEGGGRANVGSWEMDRFKKVARVEWWIRMSRHQCHLANADLY